MLKTRRAALQFLVLGIFVGLTLFVNFFHTEKTLTFNDHCPACQFQASSLAAQAVQVIHLPDLRLLEWVAPDADAKFERLLSIDISPRSPPQG